MSCEVPVAFEKAEDVVQQNLSIPWMLWSATLELRICWYLHAHLQMQWTVMVLVKELWSERLESL